MIRFCDDCCNHICTMLGRCERAAEEKWRREVFAPFVERLASGIETEGHDSADGHGAKHESPAPKGDAQ